MGRSSGEFRKNTGPHLWSPEYGVNNVPQLYHGSQHEFKPGDIVNHASTFEPDRRAGVFGEEQHQLQKSGYPIKQNVGKKFVFASDSLNYAQDYSDTTDRVSHETIPGHLYEVEPIDHKDLVHLMPNEIGSPSGFRVVKKVDRENMPQQKFKGLDYH